jgi:hypothetical protein
MSVNVCEEQMSSHKHWKLIPDVDLGCDVSVNMSRKPISPPHDVLIAHSRDWDSVDVRKYWLLRTDSSC